MTHPLPHPNTPYETSPAGIAERPWPAEVGLIKVKEALYAMGVPVRHLNCEIIVFGAMFSRTFSAPHAPCNMRLVSFT